MNGRTDRAMLDLAARLALRAAGDVEPNPLVGAVIVSPDGRVIGAGHHRQLGGPHAEIDALDRCRALGHDPRGSTLYVTLEPCRHFGRTPPCTRAIVAAGIARVAYARTDPGEASGGGAAELSALGVHAERCDASALALGVGAPFAHRASTGLPWVVAKWAQTSDGRMRTPPGAPRWISGDEARRAVHRLRARVDAIVIGIGTAIADDPLLTARGVPRLRRTALRVVIDSSARLPLGSRLVRSAADWPLSIACAPGAPPARLRALREAGAEVVELRAHDGRVEPAALLEWLVRAHGAATVLLEAGPTLLGAFLARGLVGEAIVHIAPDSRAAAADGIDDPLRAPTLDAGWTPWIRRARGRDAEIIYRRA